jgi:tRNA A-37 threonylcarbamoyl transferase component Bud32
MRVFPDDAGFCPADGSALQFASMVPVNSSEDDARLGTKLCGRYEIRRVVADGGMGRVYEGIDKQTNTRIAVKVLHSDVAKDEVSLERFKREYEISSQLPHDHIVKVLDFQRDPATSVWILVMEFLDGEELRFVLKREKMIPPERIIRMLSQVAIGLDAAHERQVVHRDLKPDNLFLCGTREGDVVKILDFGSVKDKNKDAKKLTVLGTTIGSPYYMAPEQAQGLETLDARADVFALAAITYETMTGTVPFTGNNGPSILLSILTKEPDPPTTKNGKAKYPIPPGMDDLMEVSLAKNPNIRTKSVGELADQVGRAYGLTGDHHVWAKTSQTDLSRMVSEGRSRLPAAKPPAAPAALEAAADPFAATAGGPTGGGGGGPGGTNPMQQPAAQIPQQAHHFAPPHQPAFVNPANVAPYQPHRNDDVIGVPGLDGGRPQWLIPVIVGIAALVVGGGLAIVFAR